MIPIRPVATYLKYSSCVIWHTTIFSHTFPSLTATLPWRPFLMRLWPTVDVPAEGPLASLKSCARSLLDFFPYFLRISLSDIVTFILHLSSFLIRLKVHTHRWTMNTNRVQCLSNGHLDIWSGQLILPPELHPPKWPKKCCSKSLENYCSAPL